MHCLAVADIHADRPALKYRCSVQNRKSLRKRQNNKNAVAINGRYDTASTPEVRSLPCLCSEAIGIPCKYHDCIKAIKQSSQQSSNLVCLCLGALGVLLFGAEKVHRWLAWHTRKSKSGKWQQIHYPHVNDQQTSILGLDLLHVS